MTIARIRGKMRADDFIGGLSRYFEARRGAAVSLRDPVRFASGASKETWGIDACCEPSQEWHRLIVRISRPGQNCLDTEIGDEFRLYQLLEAELPVPKMRFLEPDPQWLGGAFSVMDRIVDATSDTRALFQDDHARGRANILPRLALELARTHARPTSDLDALPGARDLGRSAAGEVATWMRTYRTSRGGHRAPAIDYVGGWLARNAPQPHGASVLVHGDFRFGNFLFDRDGLVAILDWEMAHLGDPVEDIGWFHNWSWNPKARGPRGRVGDWSEFSREYERLSGRTIDGTRLHFWLVFANFKMAIISRLGGWRYMSGFNDDLQQLAAGATANRFEHRALELIQPERP